MTRKAGAVRLESSRRASGAARTSIREARAGTSQTELGVVNASLAARIASGAGEAVGLGDEGTSRAGGHALSTRQVGSRNARSALDLAEGRRRGVELRDTARGAVGRAGVASVLDGVGNALGASADAGRVCRDTLAVELEGTASAPQAVTSARGGTGLAGNRALCANSIVDERTGGALRRSGSVDSALASIVAVDYETSGASCAGTSVVLALLAAVLAN